MAQIDDFWSHVDTSGGSDACWPWLRGRTSRGYGHIWDRDEGRQRGTHVVAWELTNGCKATLHVLHRCDNPPCCNPAHLFLGTHGDNMRDMEAKKRRTPQRGEARPHHKLTEADVIVMRDAYRAGDSIPVLARRYGVSLATIHKAIIGKTWAHVPGAVTSMRASTDHLHPKL